MNREVAPAFPFVLPFIRWADIAVLTQSESVSQRRLYDHELVYVMSGRGQIEIEDRAHPALPDCLFLIQPRVRHSFRPDKDVSLHLLGVHFDWAPQHDTLSFPIYQEAAEPVEESKFRAPQAIDEWDLRQQPFLDLRGQSEVRRALEAVVTEYARGDDLAQHTTGALLAAAILTISRNARELRYRTQRIAVGGAALRRAERARALLEAHPESPLRIEAVAQQIGWSADHLCRVFRQIWNTTPSQLQLEVRMQQARQLLRHEALSVAEIGERCGFDDASHFTRVFKAHSGLTPRQYLQLAKKR
jgi:AraC-like DNA-binding protein